MTGRETPARWPSLLDIDDQIVDDHAKPGAASTEAR